MESSEAPRSSVLVSIADVRKEAEVINTEKFGEQEEKRLYQLTAQLLGLKNGTAIELECCHIPHIVYCREDTFHHKISRPQGGAETPLNKF